VCLVHAPITHPVEAAAACDEVVAQAACEVVVVGVTGEGVIEVAPSHAFNA
jgi:hypothetical protein